MNHDTNTMLMILLGIEGVKFPTIIELLRPGGALLYYNYIFSSNPFSPLMGFRERHNGIIVSQHI